MSLRALFGGSKCRTIDKVDIFGDGSGVALYRLDGNANDEGGVYHGTESNITYGGGVYERGAVFNGSSSSILTNYTSTSTYTHLIFKTTSSGTLVCFTSGLFEGNYLRIDAGTGKITYAQRSLGAVVTSTGVYNDGVEHYLYIERLATGELKIVIDGTETLTTTGLTFTNGNIEYGVYRYDSGSEQYYNGLLDQIRQFNRALVSLELATLQAECAPTSTVDNINPFEDGSLKALYQFEGDVTDKTGVYNTLFTGAVTYTTGKFGQAGIIAGVASGTANIPFPASTGECAISYWTNNQGTRDRAFGFSQDGSHYLGIYYGGASFFNGGTTANAMGYTIANTADMKHFVWSFLNGVVKVYENAKIIYTASMAAGFTTLNTFTDGGALTTMLADQTRIFDKALTPMEVASLYVEQTPLEEPLYALVDPFKDGSGKALYRLEGNALDESGNYNGTVGGTINYVDGQVGRSAQAVGGYISTPTGIITGASPFTYSIWIKHSVSEILYVMGMGTNTSMQRLDMQIDVNGQIELVHFGNNTLSNIGAFLFDGNWHHIVITASDGTTDSEKIYVDDVDETLSFSSATRNVGTSYSGIIGTTNGAFAETIDGVEQVRIFNRGLTPTEINTLYTKGA